MFYQGFNSISNIFKLTLVCTSLVFFSACDKDKVINENGEVVAAGQENNQNAQEGAQAEAAQEDAQEDGDNLQGGGSFLVYDETDQAIAFPLELNGGFEVASFTGYQYDLNGDGSFNVSESYRNINEGGHGFAFKTIDCTVDESGSVFVQSRRDTLKSNLHFSSQNTVCYLTTGTPSGSVEATVLDYQSQNKYVYVQEEELRESEQGTQGFQAFYCLQDDDDCAFDEDTGDIIAVWITFYNVKRCVTADENYVNDPWSLTYEQAIDLVDNEIYPEDNVLPVLGYETTCSELTPALRDIFGIPREIHGDLRVGPTR